jgi:hypothetical protein
MSVCGLWFGPQRVCAVILEDSGRIRDPLNAACTPEACASLLACLSTHEVHTVVVSERSQALIAHACAARLRVELVPHALLEAIRAATGLTHRAQRYSAALLARWYLTPGLREHLRELRAPASAAQQHTLF